MAVGSRPAGGSWPTATTTLVGVIGDPVDHSLSPLLHNTAFAVLGLDWASAGFHVRAGEAAGAVAGMRALGLAGLSVTMPHKGAVAELVDECTPVAARLSAVNCLRWEGGRLVGDNTDGEGFVASLRRTGIDPAGMRCLVVGAGGAARAVILALAEAGAAEVVVVNRTAERAATAAALAGARGRVGEPEEAVGMDLVVEATPAGMAGVSETPWLVDGATLGSGQVAVDLVYQPAATRWLEAAQASGASVVGGLGMLVHQAAAQLLAWTGSEPPVEDLWRAARQALGAPEGP